MSDSLPREPSNNSYDFLHRSMNYKYMTYQVNKKKTDVKKSDITQKR